MMPVLAIRRQPAADLLGEPESSVSWCSSANIGDSQLHVAGARTSPHPPRSPHQKLWTNIPPGPLNDGRSQAWRL